MGKRQDGLFAVAGCSRHAEPVLTALNPEFYALIWRGLKKHEFRRRFLEGRPVRWFVYLNAPVSRLAAVIDLGPAIVDAPEPIAAVAEQARPGNGASVLEYVRDLDRAFAIPSGVALSIRARPPRSCELSWVLSTHRRDMFALPGTGSC